MMKKYFDDLVSGIETTLRENPETKSARKIYAREIAKLGSRLYSGEERIAWCGVTAPFDLLSCLGVTSCFVEFIGAMLASTGMIGEFLEEAEHEGYAGDTCGYHRAVIGAMKKKLDAGAGFSGCHQCAVYRRPCRDGNDCRPFQKRPFCTSHSPGTDR